MRPNGYDPWLELDRAALLENLERLRQRAGRPLMAVVKANAYGHGAVEAARVLTEGGVRHFLVAKLAEARVLREAGIEGLLLNFGPFGESEAAEIIRLGISQSVFDERVELLARAAERLGQPAHVHVKIDTGLGRAGVHHERALAFLEQVVPITPGPGVTLDGVFTSLTEEPEFDREQLARFRAVCAAAAERGIRVGLRHAASSAAVADYPELAADLDLARPGCLLYGLYPSERAEAERRIEVRPVLSLKARVVQVKTLRPGEAAGYHRAFVAREPERLATLPVGYADGFPRSLSGKGHVLLSGRRCPILLVSANAVLARLGNVPAAAGDEAVLIGRQDEAEITLSELARALDGSVYALAAALNPLLPRMVVG